MSKGLRGLSRTQEARPNESIRDTRGLIFQLYELCSSRLGSICVIVLSLVALTWLPLISDLLFVFILLIFWNAFWQIPRLPFRLPLGAKHPDLSNSNLVQKKISKPSGLYFFGNEIASKQEVWFSDEDMRTHALILGSTGSGKTQTLLSIAFNALSQGSGFIYVDGKGDNSLYAQVFSMAKFMGREDDLLVINYMTGAEDIIGPQKDMISNTLNPFALGSSSMLSQLIVSMMSSSDSGGGDGDMWKGRAISFVEALMRLLVYLRDKGYLLLEANTIRRYFILDVVEDLLHKQKILDHNNSTVVIREKLPTDVTDPMYNYLATLPGYQEKNVGKQSDKTYEQHGYITMQLTRIFGSLADVYAHIMRTNLADVDFSDVILNRRILVVLLPALEKSPDELSNLGKLIIASLKAMLAAGLGSKIQGEYKEVIESKPSNSDTPFLCILDEYGYYAVEGFAVVPAQARSLGFSVVFAGQDIPAFQKASKEEAASIFANTNIKLCMKLEDPTETWDFFNKTAGEAYVSTVRSYNMGQDGNSLGYKDSKEAGIEKRARLDLMDLKDQLPGEAHVFFKSNIVRMRSFYAAPKKTKHIAINQFLKVEPYTIAFIESAKVAFGKHHYKKLDALPLSSALLQEGMASNINISHAEDESFLTAEAEQAHHGSQESPDQTRYEKKDPLADINSLIKNSLLFDAIDLEDKLNNDYFDLTQSNMTLHLINAQELQKLFYKLNTMLGVKLNENKTQILEKLKHISHLSKQYSQQKSQVNLKDLFQQTLAESNTTSNKKSAK